MKIIHVKIATYTTQENKDGETDKNGQYQVCS